MTTERTTVLVTLTGRDRPGVTSRLFAAGAGLLRRCYAAAAQHSYLWHEFGDVHLLLP